MAQSKKRGPERGQNSKEGGGGGGGGRSSRWAGETSESKTQQSECETKPPAQPRLSGALGARVPTRGVCFPPVGQHRVPLPPAQPSCWADPGNLHSQSLPASLWSPAPQARWEPPLASEAGSFLKSRWRPSSLSECDGSELRGKGAFRWVVGPAPQTSRRDLRSIHCLSSCAEKEQDGRRETVVHPRGQRNIPFGFRKLLS